MILCSSASPLDAAPVTGRVVLRTTHAGLTPSAGWRSARGAVNGPATRITRSGSTLLQQGEPWRFAGVNMYWLGLDENRPDSVGATYPTHAAVWRALASAASLGATVVRSTTLGVSVGGPRSLEPQLGTFDDRALDAVDFAVAAAQRLGLHLMIPLTDEWHFYEGGKHTFTNWAGFADVPGQTLVTSTVQRGRETQFYTDPAVVSAFDAYLAHLLTHVNPYTGVRLGEDPTIAIWETGNELWDAPPGWTEQAAHYLKSLAPAALVADGSASSGMRMADTGYADPDVDIVDAHYYPADADLARSDAAFVAQHGKVFMIGEYPALAPGAASWLADLAADRDVSGDLAWSMLPWTSSGAEPHEDGYTFHYPGADPAEITFDAALHDHALAMNG